MKISPRNIVLGSLIVGAMVLAAGCSSSSGGGAPGTGANGSSSQEGGGGPSSPAGAPKHGGAVTMLEEAAYSGGWPAGLDPATNTGGGGNLTQDQAIFGGLFLLRANDDGSGAKVVPNQAQTGTMSPDAKTLTIKLRSGIKFSDGTPLNASAVIWNFQRATESSCTCKPTWVLSKNKPFTSPDPLTVVVHLQEPNAALLHAFPGSNVNWIVSPTAFKKMGEKQFRVKPVGAGPFVVVSNALSSKLVLKRNPTFFKKGLPYLDQLTFQSIGGAQAAYQAMLAGQGDGYEGMSEPPVIRQAQDSPKLQVTQQPGTAVWDIQLNTFKPPFNNIKAREALYYATDWQEINKGLFGGELDILQTFLTPVDLYYQKSVPGYRTYDLAKAKALVKRLGGLSFRFQTIAGYTAEQVMKALQTQWQKAGMKITIKSYQLNELSKTYNDGTWQASLGAIGAWDPAAGVGIRFWFGSHSPRSGVKDPTLDKLFAQGLATSVDSERDQVYQQISKRISDQAYTMFGFAPRRATVTVKEVHGPGVTTKIPALAVNTGIIWSEVWTEKS
jgi:peptide/nickel transport system substrate-binding protein